MLRSKPRQRVQPRITRNTLKLKYSEVNNRIIIREQIRDKAICASTLGFFFSTQNISELRILDKNESDHYPLLANVQIEGKMIKSKSNFTFRRADINRESVKMILNNE